MSASLVSQAYNALLDLAGRGKEYRVDEVKVTDVSDDTIIGTGFDLERKLTVMVDGVAVETTVELRVLAKTDDKLFIRTWLNWASPFGAHRAFVSYDLTPEAIAVLPGRLSAAEEPEITEDDVDLDTAMEMIFDLFDEQERIGTDWQHRYPKFTDDAVEYHTKVVLAAREAEPKLLQMLSDSELGAADAQEIIDLHTWLTEQPEMAALTS